MADFTQDFRTQRRNYSDGATRVGELNRLWYDSVTKTIRVGDGVTPGGIIIAGGGSGSGGGLLPGDNISLLTNDSGFTTYSSTDFNADFETKTADDLADGITNKFYSDDKVTSLLSSTSASSLSDISISVPASGDALVYNQSTGSFENTDLKLSGGLPNQVLVKQSESEYDYVWEDMIIQQPSYTKLIDDESQSGIMYVGEAIPESLESQAVWRIQKITFDSSGNVDSAYFAAGGNFDQVWVDRLTLTYS